MNVMSKLVATGSLIAAVCASACTAETANPGVAPTDVVDSLDELDTGSNWNGWSHTPSATGYWGSYQTVSSTLVRSSGDATRGGGACYVIYQSGSSCSSDTTCTTAAQATYGAGAYGYCQGGACFSRPGTQSSHCALNPNRTQGTLTTYFPSPGISYTSNDYVFGCLTKTVGPNYSCGGTDPSLYVRTIVRLNYPQ